VSFYLYPVHPTRRVEETAPKSETHFGLRVLGAEMELATTAAEVATEEPPRTPEMTEAQQTPSKASPAAPKTLDEWQRETQQYHHVRHRSTESNESASEMSLDSRLNLMQYSSQRGFIVWNVDQRKVQLRRRVSSLGDEVLNRWEEERGKYEEMQRELDVLKREEELEQQRLQREQDELKRKKERQRETLKRHEAAKDKRLAREAAMAAAKAESERAAAAMAEAEERLQGRLRLAFEDFDTDKSGTISMSELQNVLSAAKLALSPGDLETLLGTADTDKDGEINFDEFMNQLQEEFHSGRIGGLIDIVEEASVTNGWLNPMAWFKVKAEGQGVIATEEGPPAADDEVQEPEEEEEEEDEEEEAGPVSFGVSSAASSSSERKAYRVRTQRHMLSEAIVRERNSIMAEEQRLAEKKMARFKESQQDKYRAYTRSKYQMFQQAKVDRIANAEALAAEKREVGVQMRLQLKSQYQELQNKAQDRATLTAAHTLQVRQEKKAETEKRHEEHLKHGHMIALAAAEERRKRKEEALATVRKQTKATQDFAARVKHETRPEVREATRDFFQAKRDALAEKERALQQEGRMIREQDTQAFMEKMTGSVMETKELRGAGVRRAREKTARKNQQAAEEVRQQLSAENERRKMREMEHSRQVEESHASKMAQKFNPKVHSPDAARAELRHSIEALTLNPFSHMYYEC
jgi:hypothetical protein